MKILYVTDNKIFGYGGGCLECQKYYDALNFNCNGEKDSLRVISLDSNEPKLKEKQLFSLKKNRILDFFSRLLIHSTYFFFCWFLNKKKLLEYNPDIVVLERSRLGFVAKYVKKRVPNCKIVCCLDNIELDYVDGYFAESKNFASKMKIWLEKKCVYRDEKDMFSYADQIFFLTKRDYLRAQKLYGFNKKRLILPICVSKDVSLHVYGARKTVVFMGSLNYGSNLDAVQWFLKSVWLPYYKENSAVQLVIAGSNPAPQLVENISLVGNCVLKKNFDKASDVIPANSVLIAPIRTGAGMKVKVAEALSMGVSVIASDEALVGYEECELFSNALSRANSPDEIKKKIDEFLCRNDDEIKKISTVHKSLYKKFYSYERSRTFVKKIFSEYLG